MDLIGLIDVKRGRYGDVRWRGHLDLSRPKRADGRYPSIYEPHYVHADDRGAIQVIQGDGRGDWMTVYADGRMNHFATKTDAQLYAERYYMTPWTEA